MATCKQPVEQSGSRGTDVQEACRARRKARSDSHDCEKKNGSPNTNRRGSGKYPEDWEIAEALGTAALH